MFFNNGTSKIEAGVGVGVAMVYWNKNKYSNMLQIPGRSSLLKLSQFSILSMTSDKNKITNTYCIQLYPRWLPYTLTSIKNIHRPNNVPIQIQYSSLELNHTNKYTDYHHDLDTCGHEGIQWNELEDTYAIITESPPLIHNIYFTSIYFEKLKISPGAMLCCKNHIPNRWQHKQSVIILHIKSQ